MLDSNITYGEARGYEQAYIENYQTKTGKRNEDISQENRGNINNSFDHNNKTRDRDRQKYFEDAYEKKDAELKRQKQNDEMAKGDDGKCS